MPTDMLRRSVFLRLAAAIAFSFVLGALAALAGAYATIGSRAIDEADARVDAEILRLSKYPSPIDLVNALHMRLSDALAEGPGGMLYMLTEGDGSCAFRRANAAAACPFGSLPDWPEGIDPDGGPGSIAWTGMDGTGYRARGRAITHQTGMKLLVAQDLTPAAEARAELTTVMAAALGLAAAPGVLIAVFIARAALGRLHRINAFCDREGRGEAALDERLPVSKRHDEYDRLAAAINRMLDRIAELVRLNRSAAENVAHDMLTPLTTLRLKLDRLRLAATEADAREDLAKALLELDRAAAMFEGLKELARLEGGSAGALRPTDLAELARASVEMHDARADFADIRIETALEPATVDAVPALLRQAIDNLLGNAIKFQEAGGGVLVRTGCEGGRCFVEIADQGPSIPPEELGQVTQRLFRGRAHRHKPGFGLGLAWVAAIARLHGFALDFSDTRPGHPRPGLTVRLAGPAAREGTRPDVEPLLVKQV